MARVVVRKDRRMIAAEVAKAVRAEPWEEEILFRLKRHTLLQFATSKIPGFVETITVDV